MPLLKIAEDKVTETQPINVEFAKNQPQFATLPANYAKGIVSFAFELNKEDIKKIQQHQRIYVLLQTGGYELQPINVGVDPEEFDDACEYARECMTPAEGNEN